MHQCPLHKTFDFEQTFPTYDPAQTGTCRIRIFEPKHSSKTSKVVIVASQKPSSVASVTNFAERIATDVIASYHRGRDQGSRSTAQKQMSLLRREIVWIEHYPPGCMLTPQQERFSIVTFRGLSTGDLSDPEWQEVSRHFIERSLIYGELPE